MTRRAFALPRCPPRPAASYGADAPEGLGRNSKVWIAVAAPGDDDAADMYRLASHPLGADTAEVRLNDELEVSVPLAEVFPANPDILEGAEDLTQLSYLNEPSILHDLHHRYGRRHLHASGSRPHRRQPLQAHRPLRPGRRRRAPRRHRSKPHVYRVASAARTTR